MIRNHGNHFEKNASFGVLFFFEICLEIRCYVSVPKFVVFGHK